MQVVGGRGSVNGDIEVNRDCELCLLRNPDIVNYQAFSRKHQLFTLVERVKKLNNWHHKFWLLQGWAQDTKGDWGQLYAPAIINLGKKIH